MGHMVMISNFSEYFKLVQYLTSYTKKQLGLTMGVRNFIEIFDEQYYKDVKGGILGAFGKMFHNNLKVYLYPMKHPETNEIINSNNLKLHPRMKDFYKLGENPKILDIGCGKGYLLYDLSQRLPDAQIYGIDILQMPTRIEEVATGLGRYDFSVGMTYRAV